MELFRMPWPRLGILVFALCTGEALFAQQTKYGIGRPPSGAEVSAWDIAIGPAGNELPAGSGSAKQGASIYRAKCASCHGEAGRGARYDALAGGWGTLATKEPEKTIGSFWPYATTVWDYINRAEPQGEIGSLTANEVYALTAYLLNLNRIIGETEVMTRATLPESTHAEPERLCAVMTVRIGAIRATVTRKRNGWRVLQL